MPKVYVLGAGASKALNDLAPTMWELNQNVFNAIQSGGHIRLDRLKSFIGLLYPSLPSGEIILLEEVLTLLDANINADIPLASQYSVQKLRELREDFIYAISSVLKNSLGRSNLKSAFDWLKFRKKMILPLLNSLNAEDGIISLNYDLILDNHIAEGLFYEDIYSSIGAKPQPAINDDVNYGFRPRYALMGSNDYRAYHSYEFVPLLKLHSSLNWLYCPSCRHVDISLGSKGVLHYVLGNRTHFCCRRCGAHYEPLVITPSLLKTYTNPYISHIWQEAEIRLNEADEIIFVGYSMPDADIILRTIFSRAVFINRTLNNRQPHITVVDTEADDSPLVKRYRRIFGNIEYYKDGFAKYISERL